MEGYEKIDGKIIKFEVLRGHKFFHKLLCGGEFKPVGYYELPSGGTRYSYRCQCLEVSFLDD